MKNPVLCLMLFFSFVLFSFQKEKSKVTLNEVKVEAPFGIPGISVST